MRVYIDVTGGLSVRIHSVAANKKDDAQHYVNVS